jgi:hypothetical protein
LDLIWKPGSQEENMNDQFQPTLLGTVVSFEESEFADGMITDETPDKIFIESDFFTGWMTKKEFEEAYKSPE